ncbi:hypothetical protein NQ314_020159 [Rhamnusium bicolor]|uniref:Uncharacterized protein n=1 Tax=Rhamnusium bicolor TaxID=1586634 RepID=A0AAV8WKV0_9CUCU|nr:hypothetical protein NQ314_020159 [Rhamnusium bicolor]
MSIHDNFTISTDHSCEHSHNASYVCNLAGLFEENDVHEKAFRYAIESINKNQLEEDFTLIPLVNNEIPKDDTFRAVNNVCTLLNMGIVAVFGPRSSFCIDAIQSVCDVKEIPHIITKWNYYPLRDSTEINFYPHPPLLSKAYFDIIMAWEWKSFTILYEDNESLLRLCSLIQLAKDQDVLVSVQQLDKQRTGNYSSELYADDDSILPELGAWNLRTETALIIDAVHMFSTALNDRKKQSSLPIVNNNNMLRCNATDSWEHGYSVVNLLKSSSYDGLTGAIKFNNEGFRSDFVINLFELREGGVADIGTWNSSTGLNITRLNSEEQIVDEESLRNKTFIVIITLTDPYGMMKETHETLTGNDRFEGFGIDLIQKLSEMEGFNYTFILREDKKNGAKDPVTGRWSGMIGDLLEHRADLAITDFTITSDREEAVDFTVPFMTLGISILFRKPFTAPPSFFSFADPFAIDTWAALAVAFFVVAFSLYIMGRLCPDEWTNPYPCVEEPEYLINQFSLANSIWFVTGSLMCQGSEIAPIAMSTRMVAGMWWFFCLLIVASYTANLAAFLATENPLELFSDIHSLYENAPGHKITYGAKEGGATLRFFTSAEDGIFQKIGQVLKEHPEYSVKENDEGVLKAEEELYAFFMESTSIEYNTQRHCDLQQYGGLLDEKGYGIAMRKESPYRKRLSTAILKLQASQVIDELKRKWWEERRGGGQCSGNTEAPEATPLGLKNVEGCFWVTIYGTILAGLFVVIEYLIYILKVSKKARISFKEAFREEFRFYTDFNSNVKPVISNTSLDKSKSDSDEMKSKTRSKSKSKSKSRSRSPRPRPSKSKSSKESQKSKSNGDSKSPVSYGFILSRSIERLTETP